jgi:hypothetical protein
MKGFKLYYFIMSKKRNINLNQMRKNGLLKEKKLYFFQNFFVCALITFFGKEVIGILVNATV